MKYLPAAQIDEDAGVSFSLHDVLAALFRHKTLLAIAIAGVVLATAAAALLLPKYHSEMKLLVMRGRVDPVVTSSRDEDHAAPYLATAVTEDQLNSEVEMMTSADLLRQVVIDNKLDQREHPWFDRSPEAKIASAVRKLRAKLTVENVKRTDVITAAYKNRNPQLAWAVMNSLAQLYIRKHMEVHRPKGEYAFFDQQMEAARQQLAESEAKLKQFSAGDGDVAPQLARDVTIQKLNDLNLSLAQTRAGIVETANRIYTLEGLQNTTPVRVTTQARRSDNPQLLEQMKSTLLTLQLKRTELLTKYQSTYRPVQEVDQQIAETRAAIAKEEQKPLREETTDQNPTHEWVRGDLAKARADLNSLKGRAAAMESSLATYRATAADLDRKSVDLADLTRTAKSDEEKYLLYVRKREEARINDALDQQRILNVSLLQAPVRPELPAHPPWLYGAIVFFVTSIFSVAAIYVVDRFDPSFHTADEVTHVLGLPVLALVPATSTPSAPVVFQAFRDTADAQDEPPSRLQRG